MFSITDTIRESLKLAWQHKILWVFAALVAVGSNGNFNSSFDESDFSFLGEDSLNSEQEYNYQETKTQIEGMSQAELEFAVENELKSEFGEDFELKLDEEGNVDPSTFDEAFFQNLLNEQLYNLETRLDVNSLKQDFIDKSPIYIFLVALSFVALVVFSVFLGLFVRNWATGALIGGAEDVLNGQKYTLLSLSNHGRKSVRELVKFSIFMFILGLIIIFSSVAIGVISYLISPILGGIVIFLLVVAIIIFYVFVAYGTNYAYRFIIINSDKYMDAFKKGISTFKQVAGKTFMLSIANCCVGSIIGLVGIGAFLGIMIGIAAGALPGIVGAEAGATDFSIGYFIVYALIGIPLLIVVFALFSAVGAYVATYGAFSWNKLWRFAQGIDKGSGDSANEVDVFNNPPQPDNNLNSNGGSNGN